MSVQFDWFNESNVDKSAQQDNGINEWSLVTRTMNSATIKLKNS